MDLPLLYSSRPQIEQDFIRNVCNYILDQPIPEKEAKNILNWGFIFVDGRANMNFNTLEHNAMFKSCHLFSKFKYKIFCFVNDIEGLNNSGLVEKYHLTPIKIRELNSLNEYSDFWRFELYNLLPEDLEHAVTIQADGFLLRPHFEQFILNNKWDFIGAHFKHLPSIDAKITGNVWSSGADRIYGFNGGFSYRRIKRCKELMNFYKNWTFRERYAPENKEPQEDLLLSVLLNENGARIPTLKEADLWSKDPLTIEDWENNKYSFGFHYFRTISEFPPCNHE